MKKFLNIFGFLVLIVMLTACPGSNDDGVNDPIETGNPVSATLIFPENNKECTEGLIQNNIESVVTFRWQAAENADSYQVNLRNLETGTNGTVDATTSQVDIILERGTPYEWFVVSKSGSKSAPKSATWRFYNQGPGVENYAPFPAEAINPTRGQTVATSGAIMLEWSGSDVDNDITEYEVLFGTDANPVVILGTTTQSTIETTISSGQTYYWRVFTKDEAGNISESEIFDFRVQ